MLNCSNFFDTEPRQWPGFLGVQTEAWIIWVSLTERRRWNFNEKHAEGLSHRLEQPQLTWWCHMPFGLMVRILMKHSKHLNVPEEPSGREGWRILAGHISCTTTVNQHVLHGARVVLKTLELLLFLTLLCITMINATVEMFLIYKTRRGRPFQLVHMPSAFQKTLTGRRVETSFDAGVAQKHPASASLRFTLTTINPWPCSLWLRSFSDDLHDPAPPLLPCVIPFSIALFSATPLLFFQLQPTH